MPVAGQLRQADRRHLPAALRAGEGSAEQMKPEISRGRRRGRDHPDGQDPRHVGDRPARRRRPERPGRRRPQALRHRRRRHRRRAARRRSPTTSASPRPTPTAPSVGGCSFMLHVRHAAAAINEGLCNTVLITHGESGRSRVGAGGGSAAAAVQPERPVRDALRPGRPADHVHHPGAPLPEDLRLHRRGPGHGWRSSSASGRRRTRAPASRTRSPSTTC